MAHSVYLKMPEYKIGKTPVELPVYSGDTKLGTLQVSTGRIAWVPKNKSPKQKENRFGMEWEYFAQLMQEKGGHW